MKAREQGGDWGPIGCRDFAITAFLVIIGVVLLICTAT